MGRLMSHWGLPSTSVFGDLQREMNRVFDRFFDREDLTNSFESFSPKLNFAESDDSYELSLELPGIQIEDIHIEFRDGQLSISGERKEEKKESGKTYHRIESQIGQFRRLISLGNDADPDRIQATFKDGILHLHVPKNEAAQPKRIEVKNG